MWTLHGRENTMSTAISTLWVLLTKRGHRLPEAPDAADMGTCFGLDMALDDPLPPAPKTPPVAHAAPHWWHRLALRRPARA